MYNVVLLVEQELSEPDTQRVVDLYEGLTEQVRYHLTIPCEDAAAQVESSLASLAGTKLYGMAAERYAAGSAQELAAAQRQTQQSIDSQARGSLDRSIERLEALRCQASGEITHDRPTDALIEQVKRVSAQEVIVLTRPHVIAEFFHVDWSAQARRHLGIPVIHLLEQQQNTPTK